MTTATMERRQVIVDVTKNHRAWEIRGKAIVGKLYLDGKALVEIERGEQGLVVIVTRNEKKEFSEHSAYPRIPIIKDLKRYILDGYWGCRDRIVTLRNFRYNLSKRDVRTADPFTALCVALEQDAVLLPALESGSFTIEILMNTAGQCQCILTIDDKAVRVEMEEPRKPSKYDGMDWEDVLETMVGEEKQLLESPAHAENPPMAGKQLSLFNFPDPPKSMVRGSLKDRLKSLNRGKASI